MLPIVRPSLADEHKAVLPPKEKEITADHSKFKELDKPFQSGDEITKACTGCHNRAGEQLKKTEHWKWHIDGNERLGKGALVVNNFCISSNKLGDKECLDCHIGWKGQEGEVNCLVCHSRKEMNWRETLGDIKNVESDEDQSSKDLVQYLRQELHDSITDIGQPTNKNCGSCHFFSGGDDGVKRGDMSTGLLTASRDIDVHLSKDGAGLNCRDCHTTRDHQVPGRKYTESAKAEREQLKEPEYQSFLRCNSCHGDRPHHESNLNDHMRNIACQSCHIPLIARQDPTKVWWDWSKAGQLKDGKPFFTKDEFGKKNYMSIKGEFRWEKNIVPLYSWYDGKMKNYLLDEEIDPTKEVDVQIPEGQAGEPGAKIAPFKVHHGNQPYDKKLNRLLAPLLSGPQGFWTTFNWQESLTEGMKLVGLPYSGDFDYVKSRFMYPVNHTIAPKEKALGCDDCHRGAGADGLGSRMAGIEGVYVAGRGDLQWLTRYLWILLGLILFGAISHALFRMAVKIGRGGK